MVKRMEQKQYTVGKVDFILIRKRIKNVHLRVIENAEKTDAQVVVSAPMKTPISFVQTFVAEHEAWIMEQRQKVLLSMEKDPAKGKDLGTEFLFLGKKYHLQVSKGNRNTLILEDGTPEMDGTAKLTVKDPTDSDACRKFIGGWYKNRLKDILDERLPFWEKRMQLFSSGYQIRDMKSRWGSCNVRTKKLHFNLQLIFFEPECIDYVIVHELAHIREASHSARFWAIVDLYIPNRKAIRAHMRRE